MLARPNKRVNWRRRHFWRAPGSTNHRGLPTTNAEQKRWTLASRDGFFGVNLAAAAEKRRPLFLPISNTFSSGIRLEEAAALFCRCGGEVVRDCCRPDMLCMHIRLGEDRHGDPSDRGAWKPGGSTFVSAGSCHYRRRRKRWRKSTSREPWGEGGRLLRGNSSSKQNSLGQRVFSFWLNARRASLVSAPPSPSRSRVTQWQCVCWFIEADDDILRHVFKCSQTVSSWTLQPLAPLWGDETEPCRRLVTNVTLIERWLDRRVPVRNIEWDPKFNWTIFLLLFFPVSTDVPLRNLVVLANSTAELACDTVPPDRNDEVILVLWFRENVGTPIFRSVFDQPIYTTLIAISVIYIHLPVSTSA